MDLDELWNLVAVKLLINWKLVVVGFLLFGILGLALWGFTGSQEYVLWGLGFLVFAGLSYWFREYWT